jgi:hypothetical protein
LLAFLVTRSGVSELANVRSTVRCLRVAPGRYAEIRSGKRPVRPQFYLATDPSYPLSDNSVERS